jgi:hypothetical protein
MNLDGALRTVLAICTPAGGGGGGIGGGMASIVGRSRSGIFMAMGARLATSNAMITAPCTRRLKKALDTGFVCPTDL